MPPMKPLASGFRKLPPLPTFRNDRLPPPLPAGPGTLPRPQGATSDRLTPLEDEADNLRYTSPIGTWISVFSTWLNRVKFDWRSARGGPPSVPTKDPEQRLGWLTIEFLDLSVIQYTAPLPFRAFDDLVHSSSKGAFLHHSSWDLIHADYITISAAKRKVPGQLVKNRTPGKNRKNVSFPRLPSGRANTPKLPKALRVGGF